MNMITQEARKRQAAVKYAIKEGKSRASRPSLTEKSHRPHSCPTQHTGCEEKKIKKAFKEYYERYGWDGVYDELTGRRGTTGKSSEATGTTVDIFTTGKP